MNKNKLRIIMNELDRMRLYYFTTAIDEYDPEIDRILAIRANSVTPLVIQHIFEDMFHIPTVPTDTGQRIYDAMVAMREDSRLSQISVDIALSPVSSLRERLIRLHDNYTIACN